jgi:hypothetical protein
MMVEVALREPPCEPPYKEPGLAIWAYQTRQISG